MKDKLTRVKIFGTEYSLKGDEEQEYMEELSNYVDQKMREVAENSALVSTAKVAVLAALRIADELEQLKKEKSGIKTGSPAEKRIRQLIEMIDHEVREVSTTEHQSTRAPDRVRTKSVGNRSWGGTSTGTSPFRKGGLRGI